MNVLLTKTAERRPISSPAALDALIGQEIAVSPWLQIDQGRIDCFADATGDRQWLHVEPERAAQGPFGTTIAHGFLTLSLLPLLLDAAIEFQHMKRGVNYGLNKVRFPAPVPVGSRIRVRQAAGERASARARRHAGPADRLAADGGARGLGQGGLRRRDGQSTPLGK